MAQRTTAAVERVKVPTAKPFTAEESMAGLLVFVEEQERFGVFQFTTAHLISLGYVSSDLIPGKRGFRVYPAWCTDLNAQASRTQRAQGVAFDELFPGTRVTENDRDVGK
ncbi:MepB family protein [Arthrobacter sp. efr-133-TYG-104]|uniref:MepB family protein n=1 Tax=Arthrobacter sp. efr-133-TYG-104 TaxID=3040324 RepID=UPI00254F611A|nr:MepB family protein [Arthrobacter sp. efr-133-TYG-104]